MNSPTHGRATVERSSSIQRLALITLTFVVSAAVMGCQPRREPETAARDVKRTRERTRDQARTDSDSRVVAENQQALIVFLKLSDAEYGQFEEREAAYRLEDALVEQVSKDDVGEYDGHEFGGGYTTLFMYGPDANAIADTAIPIVRDHKPVSGSYAVKRYGPPGAPEERIGL
jgi:hypothetical protein